MIYLYLILAVAASVAIAYFWGHSSGKKDVQNEALKKTASVQKAQLDIAAKPADSPADTDNWLSNLN